MAKDCTSPRTAAVSEATKRFQKEILELRRRGDSFASIAKAYDMSEGYIRKLFDKAMKAIIADDVEGTRKLELLRLDDLYSKVMNVMDTVIPLVNNGQVVRDVAVDEHGNMILNEEGEAVMVRLRDLTPILHAVDRAVRIMERRAKVLGIDAPTKTALTNPGGDKEASYVQFYLPSNGRDEDGAAG